MSKSRKSFPGMIVPLIIRRWHKINIPDTSRPSAMTHRDDEKIEAVSEAISFLYPVMKYALLLLHQLHIRERVEEYPF